MAADILFAIEEFTTPLTPGVVEITSSKLNGKTPKVAIFFGSNHDPNNDPGQTDHASICLGFICEKNSSPSESAYDGHASYTAAATEDGRTTSDARRANNYFQTNLRPLAILSLDTDTVIVNTQAGDLITEGVSLDFVTVHTAGLRCFVLFIAGDDVQAYGRRIGGVSFTPPYTQSVSLEFEPDVIFFHTANQAGGTTASFSFSYGVAINDDAVTQMCYTTVHADANASGIVPTATLLTDKAVAQVNASVGAALAYTGAVSNISATGFDITYDGNLNTDQISYLALKFTGVGVALWNAQTPTVTGVHLEDAPGFIPGLVMYAGSMLETADAGLYNSNLAGGFGLGAFVRSPAVSASVDCASIAVRQPPSDPTVAKIKADNACLRISAHDDIDGVVAEFDSLDNNGFNLNYTSVESNPKQMWMLAIEDPLLDRVPLPYAPALSGTRLLNSN